MKKSKILAAVLLLAMFATSLSVVKVTNTVFIKGPSPVYESTTYSPNAYVGTPMGEKGIWIVETTETINIDGDLSEWVGIPNDFFAGVNTSLAYDANFVYVGCQWADTTNDNTFSTWNKTGLIDAGHVAFEKIIGEDDMLTVGFGDGTDMDLWTWTASDRTFQAAYEHDGAGNADGGDLPFVLNIGDNASLPGFDNTQTAIDDYFAIANGTIYDGWFTNTPTGSQTDVELAVNYTAGVYTIEIKRLLDPSQTDDIALNFSNLTDLTFYIGKANKDNAFDMDIPVTGFALAADNDPATLTFNTLTNPITESLLIKGTIFDDYLGYTFTTHLTGGSVRNGIINLDTGNWSYLYIYNAANMPLGSQQVFVDFDPKYEAPIALVQNITIADIKAPQILGVVDLDERFPEGYSNETAWIEVTCGLKDNYDSVNSIVARLYMKLNDGVYTVTPMVQFSAGGTTFNANVSLTYDSTTLNNYTYYIQAIDTSYNRQDSAKYWFIYGEKPVPVPGFGIIAAILGLAGASYILYRKSKK
ncbi:MAG: hypothetical protein JXA54_13835 [Candidatus Heimdallarchaeota archaeon]|nr:hypothetical protein [Candidatus Heimdallarchaeota archaeon]